MTLDRSATAHPTDDAAAAPVPNSTLGHIGATRLTWQRYLMRHGFMGLWGTELVPEKAAYEDICYRLAVRDVDKLREEREIVEQRGFFKCFPGRYSCGASRRFKEALRIIDEAALKVEENWASRAANEARHQALRTDDKSGQSSFMSTIVQYWDMEHDKLESLSVTTSLRGTRYYLGHSKGDFIFQYRRPIMACLGTAYRGHFEFCGQVPRPPAEYLARIEVLVPQVVRAVASVIAFHSRSHCQFPPDLQRICQLESSVSLPALTHLLTAWSHVFDIRTVRMGMHDTAVVGEFAFLIMMALPRYLGTRLVSQLAPLIVCIEKGTGLGLEGLAQIYFDKLREFALGQLFSGKMASNVLIFEDMFVNDIHALYDQPRFHSDPSHPSYRYTPVDVAAALEVARKLRDPGPDTENEDHAASSDSELSDPPSENENEDDNDDNSSQLTSVSREGSLNEDQEAPVTPGNQRICPRNAQQGQKRKRLAALAQTTRSLTRRRKY